jgi:general secretion pathway protein I
MTPPGARPRAQRGVSLIEVIVALVIVSTYGAALFTWAAQTFRTANRAVELLDRSELERNLLEVCQTINPAVQAQGKLQAGLYDYVWDAHATQALADHVKHPFGLSPYQVGLYEVQVRVLRHADQQLVLEAKHQVAGFVQARPRASGLPGFTGSGGP